MVVQMAQMMSAQEEQILRMQAERARTVSINTVDEFHRTSNAAGSLGSGLVDTRTLGKPEVFKGDPNEFPDCVSSSGHICLASTWHSTT